MRLFDYIFDFVGRFLDRVIYKEIVQQNGSTLLYARDIHRPVFGIPISPEDRKIDKEQLKYIG
jgi:hypothetical protein